MALKLKVTLIRSGINRPERQKLTIKGLGLTRMHQAVILNDSLSVRGMIRRVSHLVTVEAADSSK
ncbi:MAG: 50S ribosomal protein L30 [Polyangia bacterium]